MEYPGSKKSQEKSRLEREKNPEIFRASIGFDFIFYRNQDGTKRCKCLELNGENTGVFGVQDIPEGQVDKVHKILAGIRTRYSDSAKAYNQYVVETKENEKIGWYPYAKKYHEKVLAYIRQAAFKGKTIHHSYAAPKFLDMMFKDKSFLPELIPEQYRIKQLSFRELLKKPFTVPYEPISGKWVVKPARGIQGEGVHIVSSKELIELINNLGDRVNTVANNYVVQEFIQSCGADNDPDGLYQSARLLWDIRFFKNDTFEVDFESGYQRVSDQKVVNKKRGAQSVGLSAVELDLARDAAHAIVVHIGSVFKEDVERIATHEKRILRYLDENQR